MTALGIELTGLGRDSEVWRLEVRDELPEPNPKVKDFPGWWEGAPKTCVLPEAKRLCENAADLGDVRAMTLLGCALIGGGDLAGRAWLKRASDLGEALPADRAAQEGPSLPYSSTRHLQRGRGSDQREANG